MTEGLATSSTPESGPRGSLALGLGFAAFSAAAFGFITTLARLSYLGGGGPEAVVAARYLIAVLVMGGIVAALRRPLVVGRGDWPLLVVSALGAYGLNFGYVSSVAYIPVGLAALIFYTFPLMVAAYATLASRRRPAWPQAGGFLLAFLGLALALGPSFDALDWRGVAWALLAAVSAAALFLASAPLVARRDVFAVGLQINLLGSLLVVGSLVFLGGVKMPDVALGWGALGGASACYIAAMLTQLYALRWAGAVRAALFFNLEPLVSIALAALLLGERLAPLQLAGVALVLAALSLSTLAQARRQVEKGSVP